MKDQKKTKAQLIQELSDMRRRVSEMEASEAGHGQSEEKISHLNAVLRAIRNVNQLITKEKDLGRLLQGVCDNLVRNRGYHNVWIALLDEFKGLAAAAEAGIGSAFQPIVQRLRRGMFVGCGKKALAGPGVVVTEDPFSQCPDCPLASGYEGRAAMTVRLEFEGIVYGLLAVSVPKEMTKDEEERALFSEVAEDIAFALRNIELEEERKKAEQALKESEELFRITFETAPVGLVLTNHSDGTIVVCNQKLTELFGGSSPEEFMGRSAVDFYANTEERSRVISILKEHGSFKDMEVDFKTISGLPFTGLFSGTITKYGGKPVRLAVILDVTARKRAEQALKESEVRYRALFETSVDGILVSDIETKKIMYANPAVCRMLGYAEEELTQKSIWDIHPKEVRDYIFAGFEAQRTGNRAFGKDVPCLRKDGTLFYADISAGRAVVDGKECSIGFFRDTTERKRTEQALKESEELFRTLFETAPVGLFLTRPSDGTVFSCNQKAAEVFGGSSPKDFIGIKTVGYYVNPEDRSRMVATLKEHGFFKDVEVPFKTLDGRPILILFSGTMTRYSGEPVLLSVVVDITDRKKTEEALKESEELFRTLFETAPVGLVLTRIPEGTVVACNQKIAEMFEGSSPDEIVGKNAVRFYARNEDRARVVKAVREYGMLKDFEVVFKGFSGREFWALASGAMTKYGGEPVMLSVLTEITDRKKAEEALQKARNELESRVEERTFDLLEANRRLMREIKDRIRAEGALKKSVAEKEILIREIHHRVKNNLQVISSLLDMGKMRIKDASQAVEMFKEAGAIIQAMALIHSMLYGTGRFESVNIADFVRKLYVQLAQMYAGQSKKIVTDFRLEDVYLSIDKAVPLGLVLNEILANVFKHAFPEEDSGRLEIRLRKDYTDTVFLSVSDNGAGIPEEVDVEAANSMGLKLIRIIVREQLRGELRVERDQGTTVYMEFMGLRTGGPDERANA